MRNNQCSRMSSWQAVRQGLTLFATRWVTYFFKSIPLGGSGSDEYTWLFDDAGNVLLALIGALAAE